VAAGTTGSDRHIGVYLCGRPTCKALVAGHASWGGRGRDMATGLVALSATAAGVATRAIGGYGETTVIDLTVPVGRGVAALAVCHTAVKRVVGLGSLAISGSSMAACTASDHRHIGVNLGGCPTGKALVTGHASCRGGCGRDMATGLVALSAATTGVATRAVGR